MEPHTWSDKVLRGTVANRTLPSLQGVTWNYAYIVPLTPIIIVISDV